MSVYFEILVLMIVLDHQFVRTKLIQLSCNCASVVYSWDFIYYLINYAFDSVMSDQRNMA